MIDYIEISYENPQFIAELAKFNVEIQSISNNTLKPITYSGFWSMGDDSVEIIAADANTVYFTVNEQVKAVYYMPSMGPNLETRRAIGALISRERFVKREYNVYKRHPDDQYMNKVNEFLDKWGRV